MSKDIRLTYTGGIWEYMITERDGSITFGGIGTSKKCAEKIKKDEPDRIIFNSRDPLPEDVNDLCDSLLGCKAVWFVRFVRVDRMSYFFEKAKHVEVSFIDVMDMTRIVLPLNSRMYGDSACVKKTFSKLERFAYYPCYDRAVHPDSIKEILSLLPLRLKALEASLPLSSISSLPRLSEKSTLRINPDLLATMSDLERYISLSRSHEIYFNLDDSRHSKNCWVRLKDGWCLYGVTIAPSMISTVINM